MPSVTITNDSDQRIYISMDHHREDHALEPKKEQDYTNFNWGDLPTFRAFRTANDMMTHENQVESVKCPASAPFHNYGDFSWNGASFDDN
jgi:hypothetical protein